MCDIDNTRPKRVRKKMDRKVYVNVTTRLIIRVDEGSSVNEVLENMDYSFTSDSDNADIQETEILDWEIVDSK